MRKKKAADVVIQRGEEITGNRLTGYDSIDQVMSGGDLWAAEHSLELGTRFFSGGLKEAFEYSTKEYLAKIMP